MHYGIDALCNVQRRSEEGEEVTVSDDVDSLKQPMKKSEKQGEHILSNSNSDMPKENLNHIMTVVNSQFETMPLGLSQDIPDVRL